MNDIYLYNKYHQNCVCSYNFSPQLSGGGLFTGDFPFPFDARSGIRTHEANATDLKSVPFDRSGIRALCLYVCMSYTIIYESIFIFFYIYYFFCLVLRSARCKRRFCLILSTSKSELLLPLLLLPLVVGSASATAALVNTF